MTQATAPDQAALIRATAVRILAAANTIAGDRVEQERVDGIADGDTPRLIIFADEQAQSVSPAGTALTFEVTLNMIIQALVQDAILANAVWKLDTLVAQVKTAILCAPAFTTLFSTVSSFRVNASYKAGGAYITGDARILLTGTWYETYNPDLTTILSGLNTKTAVSNTQTITSQFLPGS